MSGRRYSGRRYRRRRSPVPVILLLIVAAALVLGALAIFTDVFKKDRPADRADRKVLFFHAYRDLPCKGKCS